VVGFWSLRSSALGITSVLTFRQATQNVEAVAGCIGREKIRNGVLCPSRTQEKFNGPLCDTRLRYMNILAWRWFIDVFFLQDQGEWFFCAWRFPGKTESFRVGCEGMVVVVSVFCVRRAALRMAPHAVLKNGVPDKASATEGICGIRADLGRIDCSGISLRGSSCDSNSSALRLPPARGACGARKGPFSSSYRRHKCLLHPLLRVRFV
jgi:hypothetical protein